MQRTARLIGFVVLLVMALVSTAGAQRRRPRPAPTPPPAEAPPPAPVPPPQTAAEREARELFEQGREAYASGRFAEARDRFQRSYDLSGRSELLYNIAQASDRTRDDRHALEVYRAYLEAVPDSDSRAFVESRIEFLDAQLREAEAARVLAAQQAASAAEESRGPDLGALPVTLVVSGSGLAVAGGVLLGLGIRGRNQVEDAPDGTRYDRVRAGGERARGMGYAGQIALGVGVAVALTGVILVAVSEPDDSDDAREAAQGLRLTLSVGPGDITLIGRF